MATVASWPVTDLEGRLDPSDIVSLELDEWGELASEPKTLDLHEHVAAVHAQLEPIRSRSALLDSFRRESLSLLAPAGPLTPAAAALEIAYALRWCELENEAAAGRPRMAPLYCRTEHNP